MKEHAGYIDQAGTNDTEKRQTQNLASARKYGLTFNDKQIGRVEKLNWSTEERERAIRVSPSKN